LYYLRDLPWLETSQRQSPLRLPLIRATTVSQTRETQHHLNYSLGKPNHRPRSSVDISTQTAV
jgi:hypothetical protein